MQEIIFENEVSAIGRNGSMRCKGLAINHYTNEKIVIMPITSKMQIGNCLIDIPVSSIPILIENLQKILMEEIITCKK